MAKMTVAEIIKRLGVVLAVLLAVNQASAAPGPCQGPNKNNPGCPGTEPAPASTAVISSVTVDWVNQQIIVRGSGFVPGSTSFTLGSSAVAMVAAGGSDTETYLPFDADMAAQVLTEGNYALAVDGVIQLSAYIEAQVVDPAATGCPCEADWIIELGALWGKQDAECLEIEGPLSNDAADIAATILTDPLDPGVAPVYPIGAAFNPAEPTSSVCRLARVNADASTDTLVDLRINEIQQADCAALLTAQVCTTP